MVHHDLLIIHVVRDHRDDVDRQRPDAPAIKQVVQAMAKAADHDQHLHLLGLVVEGKGHAEFAGGVGKALTQLVQRFAGFRGEADPHEEIAGLGVVELRAVGDVAAIGGHIGRDGGDDAAPRRASHCQGKMAHLGLLWGAPAAAPAGRFCPYRAPGGKAIWSKYDASCTGRSIPAASPPGPAPGTGGCPGPDRGQDVEVRADVANSL